jgi:hypothetical protein
MRSRLDIGPKNVEELVFMDSKIWRRMPRMSGYRDQWSISLLDPSLRPTGRKAMLDFLMESGPEEERALSDHFGTEVTIDNLDARCVKELEFVVGDEPDFESFHPCHGLATTRDGDIVKVTLWR